MAECSVQTLLDDARCFYGLNPAMLDALKARLVCEISEVIVPPAAPEPPPEE